MWDFVRADIGMGKIWIWDFKFNPLWRTKFLILKLFQFTSNLFLSLLICCSRQDCRLDAYFCSTTLSSLIQPCSQEVKCSVEQYIALTLADVKTLDTWSASNINGYHGSAAEKLIQNLQLACRLQGSRI